MALELPGAPEQRVRASGSVDVGACGCLCWAEGSASSRQKGKRRNEVPPPPPAASRSAALELLRAVSLLQLELRPVAAASRGLHAGLWGRGCARGQGPACSL